MESAFSTSSVMSRDRTTSRESPQLSATRSPSLGLREVSSLSDSETLLDPDEDESNRNLLNTLVGGTPFEVGGILLNPTAGAISEDADDSQYDAVLNSLVPERVISANEIQELSDNDMQNTPENSTLRQLIEQETPSRTEEPSNVLGEIHSMLTMEEHPEWGEYPYLSTVINDIHFAGELEESGILNELTSIAYTSIANLGDMRLPDALGSLILDPYTQVVLAVCHKFYSSLPSLGMNMDAFKVLHYYRRISTINGPGMPVDELVRNWYSELSAAGLDDLMTKISMIFINHSQAQFSDLETGVSRLTLENRLALVRQHLPQACTIFNMLSHFCLGGIECIEPVPEMIKGNIGLSRYITAIARGNGDIHTLALSITPRPPDRPVARYRPEAHAHQSRTQSTQPPNSSVSLPPLTFSPIANPELSQPMEQRPVSTGLALPLVQFGTVVQEEIGETSGEAASGSFPPPAADSGPRQIHTVTNAPGSLLAQGNPSGIQIIRDTTSFRDRIQERIDTSGELTSINSKVDMILDEVRRMATELTLCRNENEQQMKQELQIMSRNYTELNRSFTLMIAQSSQHNLAERQLINSQLMQPQTQEGSQIIATAQRVAPAPADELRNVIHRLETYPSSNEQIDDLVNDVKSLLETMGKRDLARGVTAASINNPMTRARALAILKNVPRI